MVDGVSLASFERDVQFRPERETVDIRARTIRDLITTPGVRLVLPSEQTEDVMTGLAYSGEFDRFRTYRTNDSGPNHDGFLTSYARVFVNQNAHPYMKREPLRFPAGSMIVRERLNKASDESAQMLSVMIKRERGFSPITNDWEFALVETVTQKMTRGRSTASCVECHAKMRSNDLLFKTYLP